MNVPWDDFSGRSAVSLGYAPAPSPGCRWAAKGQRTSSPESWPIGPHTTRPVVPNVSLGCGDGVLAALDAGVLALGWTEMPVGEHDGISALKRGRGGPQWFCPNQHPRVPFGKFWLAQPLCLRSMRPLILCPWSVLVLWAPPMQSHLRPAHQWPSVTPPPPPTHTI